MNVPVRVEPVGRKRGFHWNANRLEVDRVAAIVSEYGQSINVASNTGGAAYSLGFAARGHAEFSQGNQTATSVAGVSALLTVPSAPVHCRIGPGYEGIQIMIPGPVLEGAFSAILGVGVDKQLGFEMALGRGSRARGTLARLVRYILNEGDRQPSILSWPIIASNLVETLLHALVLGWPHRLSRQLERGARPAEPVYLRRAEEYLAANPHRAVTSTELAFQTGVSVRSIQGAFRLHRDSTPSAFLRSRRFELARQRLLTTPGCTVTDVAFGCGFEHLGRFSLGYRARFGESPSQTLRRAGPPPPVFDEE
jgi:AraC-like DNA-binding protein